MSLVDRHPDPPDTMFSARRAAAVSVRALGDVRQRFPTAISSASIRWCSRAWFGMLATALNLLPFGQLDGGHITYATLRRAATPISLVTVARAVVMSFFSLQLGADDGADGRRCCSSSARGIRACSNEDEPLGRGRYCARRVRARDPRPLLHAGADPHHARPDASLQHAQPDRRRRSSRRLMSGRAVERRLQRLAHRARGACPSGRTARGARPSGG